MASANSRSRMSLARTTTTTTVNNNGVGGDETASNHNNDAESAASDSKPHRKVARQKHIITLKKVCEQAKVKLDEAHLIVCEGRKVVYVLSHGEIDSERCIVNEKPTPSFRKSPTVASTSIAVSSSSAAAFPPDKTMLDSEWPNLVIPNGWKVAVIVNMEPWIAEVQRDKDGKPTYGFTLLDENAKVIVPPDWRDTPGAAFKASHEKSPTYQDAGRHNGKLYIGVTYERPQQMLREMCRKQLQEGKYDSKPNLKKQLSAWANFKPSDAKKRKPASASNEFGSRNNRSQLLRSTWLPELSALLAPSTSSVVDDNKEDIDTLFTPRLSKEVAEKLQKQFPVHTVHPNKIAVLRGRTNLFFQKSDWISLEELFDFMWALERELQDLCAEEYGTDIFPRSGARFSSAQAVLAVCQRLPQTQTADIPHNGGTQRIVTHVRMTEFMVFLGRVEFIVAEHFATLKSDPSKALAKMESTIQDNSQAVELNKLATKYILDAIKASPSKLDLVESIPDPSLLARLLTRLPEPSLIEGFWKKFYSANVDDLSDPRRYKDLLDYMVAVATMEDPRYRLHGDGTGSDPNLVMQSPSPNSPLANKSELQDSRTRASRRKRGSTAEVESEEESPAPKKRTRRSAGTEPPFMPTPPPEPPSTGVAEGDSIKASMRQRGKPQKKQQSGAAAESSAIESLLSLAKGVS